MPSSEHSPVLADAADVLSDQLRHHLQRLAVLVRPRADALERRFLSRLRALQYTPKQRTALAAITPGAAARLLADGQSASGFFEQIEYNGRRLAKLNLPPTAIVTALQEYDRLLTPTLRALLPDEYANFHWVREQLHFCVILTLNNAYYQVREAETQAFYELFRVELESRTLDELLNRFLHTLVRVCGASAGQLSWLSDDGAAWHPRAAVDTRRGGAVIPASFPATAAQRKALCEGRYFLLSGGPRSLLLTDAWQRDYQSCWSMPLRSGDRTAGVLQFAFPRRYEWLPREQELLAAAAERCLMAAEKARLVEDLAQREEQVRQLAEHMLHVEEIERRRISRELHDEAGQSLLCVRLQLEMMEGGLPPEQADLGRKLGEARDLTEHTIIEIRRLIAALSPSVLESLGLGAALRQLVTRFRGVHPSRVRMQLTRLDGLPKKTETIVYRLVQECFNNIAKHSCATQVNISVGSADGRLRLSVEDNGVGFDAQEALAKRESFGLSGIRERVALLGGSFEVVSRRAPAPRPTGRGTLRRGTRITIELPIPSVAPQETRVPHGQDTRTERLVAGMAGR